MKPTLSALLGAIRRGRIFAAPILAAVMLAGCDAQEKQPDFTPYLQIPAGTKIKLVRKSVSVEGGDSATRQRLQKSLQDGFERPEPGILVEITKDHLVFQRDSDSAKMTYAPSEVRAIEVIEPASK